MAATRPEPVQQIKPKRARRPKAEITGRSPDDFPVVGIGASAGGLEACKRLVAALPKPTGMAFILIQHLDPTHESMMVDLLAGHTTLTVIQAADGMPVEREHVYVIPPGTYLSVEEDVLHLSQPRARRGARLPFDFLLSSLAEQYGARAVCVVLSGSGADGSLGLKSIKGNGGLVIAQEPTEAGYDGMPRSAIATGAVDMVLPVAEIGEALVRRGAEDSRAARDWLPAIIDLLRTRTVHDFTLYKRGTLQRRIARRMSLIAIKPKDMERYLGQLRNDPAELDLLAKDLLINVTSFFRDPKLFEVLAEIVIPELLDNQRADHPVRVWVAGCSTGEETYSLAILFREAMIAAKRNIKVQIFASDIDPDAVADAREGVYTEAIAAHVSPERLARFFSNEEGKFRILPELRALVIFAVQDLLADPPFSRLDMVSCRNLLIYLRPEAQTKVISLFHFALRENGILILGGAETVAPAENRFTAISKSQRIYRHVGRGRPGDLSLPMTANAVIRPHQERAPQAETRQSALGDLCQRVVMENFAPAAVLINHKHECLFYMGPTDRYLRIAPGHASHDLLAMARDGIRTKLRAAIQQAGRDKRRVVISGGRTTHNGAPLSFSVAVQPVPEQGEELFLVCFIDEIEYGPKTPRPVAPKDAPRVAELEIELEATRMELQGAIRNLEIANEDQKAINEEALSVNEEYQSTNEELLTSKEELQSVNEELTALNGQLQETLERQRTTSNDLQNVLYSTDVATIFLDSDLNIRFFTPATRSLFNVIPSDIGRPLADLSSVATDDSLLKDAQAVLGSQAPAEREIAANDGAWYIRRILPYRTQNNDVEGVVITFADVTERKHAADALEAAKRQAEAANLVKSRFLAAASHDLRQPLQTLALLQGLLAKLVEGDRLQELVERLDDTLSAMSGMLNTLLDINQIEAGIVQPQMTDFPIDGLLRQLRDEFSYHAEAQGLTLRVVPCSLTAHSDPRLLEQMIRNLLSNALKYTRRGKVLLGCRRRSGGLTIEILDTGIGIAESELAAIFDEYYQIDNAARERSRGMGLGLSIVKRLGNLMGHRIHVRSRLGRGSAFAIDILRPQGAPAAHRSNPPRTTTKAAILKGRILVVDDDPEVRELLTLFLNQDGHEAMGAPDGAAALSLVETGAIRPELLLADYNLPGGMDGIDVARKLRAMLDDAIPVIIVTGDISIETFRTIADQDCVQLNKPVKLTELTKVIQRLLAKQAGDSAR
jgi:two-component system CheB/CheR fusion protein